MIPVWNSLGLDVVWNSQNVKEYIFLYTKYVFFNLKESILYKCRLYNIIVMLFKFNWDMTRTNKIVIYLKCIIWFNVSIHERSPTVQLINTFITSHIYFVCLFVLVKTFKLYSVNKFQWYNTELSPVVTMLFSISSDFIHLITESMYSFTSLFPFPSPAPGNHHSSLIELDLYFYLFILNSTYNWYHARIVFLFLAYFT